LIKKQAVSAAYVADHIRIRPNKAGMIKRALFISFVFSSRLSLPNFTDTAQKAKAFFGHRRELYVNGIVRPFVLGGRAD
jgi:hypothetical protein